MHKASTRRWPTWVKPLAGAVVLHACVVLVVALLRAPPRPAAPRARPVDIEIVRVKTPPTTQPPPDEPSAEPPPAEPPHDVAPAPAPPPPRRTAPPPASAATRIPTATPAPEGDTTGAEQPRVESAPAATVPEAPAPVTSPVPASPVQLPAPAPAPTTGGTFPTAGNVASSASPFARGRPTLTGTATSATALTYGNAVARAAPAQLLRRTEPGYPVMARRAGVQGRVMLALDVDERGRVVAAVPLSGPAMLRAAAADAARTWMFAPARGPDGRAVRARVDGAVDFRLR